MTRTFIIGAGFSKPAEFPLGDKLFSEIVVFAQDKGLFKHISNEIDEYMEYIRITKNSHIHEEDIKLEDLMSYIDTKLFLMTDGSEELGISQNVIKNLLAYCLYLHEKKINGNSYLLYEKFASNLTPGDRIFTFNYDTILEQTFTRKNIPFRLYPTKFKASEQSLEGMEPDMDSDDIILYKMHGSINWFDNTIYLEAKEYERRTFGTDSATYSAYNILQNYETTKLLGELYPNESSLKHLYILNNMEKYFKESNFILNAPVIMSPSHSKILNINPLLDLWYGFSQHGEYAQKITVIGYSLPEYDDYVRIPLYRIIKEFQETGDPFDGKKSRLKIVDKLDNEKDVNDYKSRYSFVNWDERKTHCHFKGFSEEAVDMIFTED